MAFENLLQVLDDEACHFVTRMTFGGCCKSCLIVGELALQNRSVAEGAEQTEVVVGTEPVAFANVMVCQHLVVADVANGLVSLLQEEVDGAQAREVPTR